MSASTTSYHEPRLVRRAAPVAAAAAGAVYGLALARFLFELDPLRLGFFGDWPGVLLCAAAGLAIGLALSHYARRLDPTAWPLAAWAPLGLMLPIVALLASDVNLLRAATLLSGAWALLLLLAAERGTPHADLPRAGRLVSALKLAPRFYPLLLFVVLFLLYLRTLAPAVGQADTFEFQVDVARLGIAHGSGYPLLMLIGRLFTLLPVGGTLAFRANLSSAFFAALAGVGVERIARRLGVAPLIALLAGLAFGVSPALWSRAVEIEVFALNATLVAAILYLCFDLVLPLPAAGEDARRFRTTGISSHLLLLTFLFGLSLTNHLTSLFLAPACLLAAAVALWRQRHAPAPAQGRALSWGLVCLAFLLGLSVYLYIPLRWPAVNNGQLLSLAGFANILTGNEAKGAFQWRLPFQDAGRYAIVWSKIAGEYGWPGLALALAGIVSLLWPAAAAARQTAGNGATGPAAPATGRYPIALGNLLVLLVLVMTSLGYIYFALAFNVPDPSFSSYLIPVHLMAAVLMALGVQGLAGLISAAGRHWPAEPPASTPVALPNGPSALAAPAICLLLCAFCLLPLRSIWQNFPVVDHSGDWAAEKLGELMLGQPLAQGAAILADSQKIAPLDYLQIAGGLRPDLDIIVLPDEASYRAALDERLAAGQVVYLGRYLPGLSADYSLRSIGPLVQVSPVPFSSLSIPVQSPLTQSTASASIDLVGYATSTSDALRGAASDMLDLTLVWHSRAVPSDNLLVSLRLVDGTGQTLWQSAGSVPAGGLYPTNAWRAGEYVSDFYRLPVSPSLPPSSYQVQAALAPPFANIPESAWSAVAPVTIAPPAVAPTPTHAVRDSFGPNWLLGYDLPPAVAPGSRYAVTLYWLRSTAALSVTALGETRSLAAWPAGAVVPVVYNRVAPAQGDQISLAVATGAAARCGWLAPPSADCPLPPVRLAGQAAAKGAVNFDNQILLTQARLATTSAAPGGQVTVDLEWQALRAIGADYTVFVHLLGPDGLVHGQIDRWPVSGTRATSGWAPGEHIVDQYVIPLPPDAPPGAYHVEIGLYLLATGERLPVLNADGLPVDDRLLLAGLRVGSP